MSEQQVSWGDFFKSIAGGIPPTMPKPVNKSMPNVPLTKWTEQDFKQFVAKQGFSPDLVKVSTLPPDDLDNSLPIDPDKREAAGYLGGPAAATEGTKGIIVYPMFLPSGQEEETMAHELMHVRFHAVVDALQDGRLSWDRFDDTLLDIPELAAKRCGTPYSEAFWKEWTASDGNKFSAPLCVDETLAEIARIAYSRGELPPMPPLWKKLYEEVMKAGEEIGVASHA